MSDLTAYDAVLFDLDGVLTPTADVHMSAWRALFQAYFADQDVTPGYIDEDYFVYLDGKPRYEGVNSLLLSRGIELPWGSPDDPSAAHTVCGLGNRKNDVFSSILMRDGVTAFPGSVRLLNLLAERKIPLAVVSSSKNAEIVLAAAGLRDRFVTVVDGALADIESIAGKPAPDMFLRAAEILLVEPARAVVVEDAVSGVAAGHAGHFGLVVGVNRGVGAEALTAAGADRVVSDLDDLAAEIDPGIPTQDLPIEGEAP
ncbi:beta-phosphoglucomutase family hydrolase [Klugiella xanthotipulae]|uniref:Beta-phosphoglucomutase n=1 Tax=Klugiella xanthotipulae TaxID=244735 RepID=A0A543HT80_9MICO|nr:beta-phosphoglucomutase family hydrolase [Klugiella xanthotipulae]TQM61512.1 HAD superfamily hydrolase (TIGR01509 family)/beta-phosphoglucomutase family hydrolase [Klugiella xanthotipulae]